MEHLNNIEKISKFLNIQEKRQIAEQAEERAKQAEERAKQAEERAKQAEERAINHLF